METTDSHNVPSRFNGENIAGAAFIFFAFLFMIAGQVNAVFALLYPVDYMLVAVGVALVLLGYRTWRNEMKKAGYHSNAHEHGHEHGHGYS